MTFVLPLRWVLISCLAPVLLCVVIKFTLDARMVHGASPAPDPASPNCFATLGNSTQFSSVDAAAVQQAVDTAAPDSLVKVAGVCAGVEARADTTQTVFISKTLTLQGGYTISNWLLSDPLANPTILDAKRLGRVVNATADLSLSGLTVQNASITTDTVLFVPVSGGGIVASGNLTLSQMMVVSNTLTCRGNILSCNGPGAYTPGSASVDRSVFLNNTCAITVTFGCYGALYVGGTAELSSTRFISNAGGGAYIGDAVIVTSSQFVSNTNGGLIVKNSALVTGSQFVSNSIGTVGGGLSVYNGTNGLGTAIVVNSQFTNNVGSYLLYSGGGGMFAVNATVINSLFFGNVGDGAGGGLAAGSLNVHGPYGSATVVDSQFISNTATATGGGLDSFGPLVMTRTQFIGNSAGTAGGAEAYVTATVSGGLFQANSATQGGGLVVAFGPLTLNGTQFISNTTSGGFGGVGGAGLAATRAATVTSALFEDNHCNGANCLGGAIYVSNTLTVSLTQFLSNTASMGGAVYALGGGTLHGSCVAGNQLAAVTNVTGTFNASYNWWGATDGPTPPGHGDTISGTVSTNPFLTTPIFACPSLGFGTRLFLPIMLR